MPNAREDLVFSLTAMLAHINQGGLADTALPGTSTAEAMRLVKNGVSVAGFACFEMFIRARIGELLEYISNSHQRPAFDHLPDGLKLAATRGVVNAVRYRISVRGDDLDVPDTVSIAQRHAQNIDSTAGSSYKFSEWAFGYDTPNVSGKTLTDYLGACDAPGLGNKFSDVLSNIGFDFVSAGLANPSGNFKMSNLASWRHTAAHDATTSIDAPILKTRILAYLALAFAFDVIASYATERLIDRFSNPRSDKLTSLDLDFSDLISSSGTDYLLQNHPSAGTYYSVNHCMQTVGHGNLPTGRVCVVRDSERHVVDWFFIA